MFLRLLVLIISLSSTLPLSVVASELAVSLWQVLRAECLFHGCLSHTYCVLQFSLVGFSVSLVSSAFYFLKVAGLLIILFLVSIAVRGLFFKKNFFCFLMSLTNGLSILFILSNNKLLALLIFFYGLLCFFCIYFCPNFKDFFPSTNLGLFISSFSSCFRCRVRLFIWLFSWFLRYACIVMNFPLSTAFTVSHRFWVVVFSFSFVSMHFLIYSVIFWLFNSVLFSLHMLEFLIFFLL